MPEPTAPAEPPVKPEGNFDYIERLYKEAEEKSAQPPKPPEPKPAEPPPTTPATTPAATTPDPDEEPKGISPKLAIDWKRLKGERNDISAKYKATLAELEAERAKPRPDPREIEAIRKERDVLDQRLQQLDVERHPKFQEYFGNKTASTLSLAKSIVGDANAKRLQDALEMPEGAYRDAALEEITGDLKPIQQSRLGAVVVEFDRIRQEKTQHIAQSRENWQKLQENQQQQSQAAQVQYLKAFDEATARATDPKEGLPVFQKRSGTTDADTAWNQQVDQSLAIAKNIFQGKLDAPEIAKAALWSASAPLFLAQLHERNEVISGLQKRISELEASKPSLNAGGATTPPGGEDKYKGMSYMDAMVAKANDAGAFR